MDNPNSQNPPKPPVKGENNNQNTENLAENAFFEEQRTNYTPQSGDFGYSWREKLKSRFNSLKFWFVSVFQDRRKALIVSAVLIVLIGGLTAFFVFRQGDGSLSDTTADDRGNLPIAGQTEPDFIPQVYRPGDGTIVVEWVVDRPTDGRVDYGVTQNYGYFSDDQSALHPGEYDSAHTVILRDLDSSQTYNLLASSADRDGNLMLSKNIRVQPLADSDLGSVEFVRPTDGSVLSGLESVCADVGGSNLKSLTLLVDSNPVTKKTSNFNDCFILDTGNFENGAHTLGLLASDGGKTTSVSIGVRVDNTHIINDVIACDAVSDLIEVNLAEPQDQSTVSGVVDTEAEVSVRNMEIRQVFFIIKSVSLSTDSVFAIKNSAPYVTALNTLNYSNGNYIVKAVAQAEARDGTLLCSSMDDEGNHTANITIQNNNLPPGCESIDSSVSVNISQPDQGDELSGRVDVAADVSNPNNRQVGRVAFMLGDTVFKEDINSPYLVTLDTTNYSNGMYALKAFARLEDNSCSQTSEINIHIDNSDLFGCTLYTSDVQVNINQPSSGSTLTDLVSIEAEVDAGERSIEAVVFAVDDDEVATVIQSPYQTEYNTALKSNGGHRIKAVARMQDGVCGIDTSDVIFDNSNNTSNRPRISFINTTSTNNSITVTWRTNQETNSRIEYGLDTDYGRQVQSSDQTQDHSLVIENLEPGTEYYLKIGGQTSEGVEAVPRSTKKSTTNQTGTTCGQVGQNRFYGCYYNDLGFSNLGFTRFDRSIDFTWSEGQSPAPNIESTDYSIVWRGEFEFEQGRYEFNLTVDDGARLYVGDELLIDAWQDQASTVYEEVIDLSGEEEIRLEYYQRGGQARISLFWENLGPCISTDQVVNVSINSPFDGEVLSENIEVTASVNAPVDSLTFYLDDSIVDIDTEAPYSTILSTRGFVNGPYTLTAVPQISDDQCLDSDGEGDEIDIQIQNSQFSISNTSVLPEDILTVLRFTTSVPADSIVRYGTTRNMTEWDPNDVVFVSADGDISRGVVSGAGESVISIAAQGDVKLAQAFIDNPNGEDDEIGDGPGTPGTPGSGGPGDGPGSLPKVSISASPDGSIISGQEVTLSWQFEGIDESTLRNSYNCTASWLNGGEAQVHRIVTEVRSDTVAPVRDATYTIKCDPVFQGDEELYSFIGYKGIDVIPVKVALQAEPSLIRAGESAALSWQAQGALSCSADWFDGNDTSGTTEIKPETTTTYSIACFNSIESDSDQVRVEVENAYTVAFRNLTPQTTYYYQIESTVPGSTNQKDKTDLLSFSTTSRPDNTDLTASISWTSDCSDSGRVYYDRFSHGAGELSEYSDSPYGGVATSAVSRSGNEYLHTAVLVGLSSSSTYHYRYTTDCEGFVSGDGSFKTPAG